VGAVTSEGGYFLRDCDPGTELFRSDRPFMLLAHMGTKGQALLRSVAADPEGTPPETHIDLLFLHTTFLRIHHRYNGLVIRMPTTAQSELIQQSMPPVEDFYGDRGHPEYMQPVVLESDGKFDFVIAEAFQWCEADGSLFEPSRFAEPYEPDGPPWMRQPLVGVDAGLGTTATATDVREALEDPQPHDHRDRYRYVYVLMFKTGGAIFANEKGTPRAVFLTRQEAESEAARQRAKTAFLDESYNHTWWVEAAPVAL
jgi:hypothetical protein